MLSTHIHSDFTIGDKSTILILLILHVNENCGMRGIEANFATMKSLPLDMTNNVK